MVSLTGTPWQASKAKVKIESVEAASSSRELDEAPLDKEGLVEDLRQGIAMRYALAVQQRNTDEVIRMTKWMQDRLRYVRGTSDAPEAVEEARRALRENLTQRRTEENQLGVGGVEDKYVFAPGALLTPLGTDEGEKDVEPGAETKRQTWIRVTYPDKRRALKNEEGAPIRELKVGVTVSTQGQVLKVGIQGNLNIDEDSILRDWAESQGE
jgi:hypothetical protein